MGNVVDGVVEVKNDKFNGSLKVNGTWYSFARGVDNSSVHKGDSVSLTLAPWQSNGKSGFNISSFVVKEEPKAQVAAAPKVEAPKPAQKASLTEDQIRGQIRTHLVASSMPILLTGAVDLDGSLEMINKLTEFVMKGKVE